MNNQNIETVIKTYNVELLEQVLNNQNEILARLNRIENSKRERENEYMDIQELIDFLPQKPAIQTVYGWVSNRLIPYKKVSGKLYFKKDDIIQWLDNDRKVNYMKS